MGRGRKFPYERAASAIVLALYEGDKAACDEFDVPPRTLTRWRMELCGPHPNAILANYVQKKTLERDARWARRIPAGIEDFIEFLRQAMRQKPITAEMINAIGDGFERMARIHIATRIVDERLAAASGSQGLEDPGAVSPRALDGPDSEVEDVTDSE